METIVIRGDEKRELRVREGEERAVIFLAAESTEADIQAVIGEGARLRMLFLFAGNDDDRISARLAVRHEGADSVSEVIVRGVLYNRSCGLIEGAVSIAPAAQRAQARFEGKALIEGAGAADIVPMLEILTPDAKEARHGAAVARLSDEERFYLESRGLSPSEAVRVAAFGFLSAPFSCAIEIPREFECIVQKLNHAF